MNLPNEILNKFASGFEITVCDLYNHGHMPCLISNIL